MARPRRHRHIPATDAELAAWNWGRMLPDDVRDWLTNLAFYHAHPGAYMTADAQAAWDRLGPARFWAWALAGHRARAEEELEETDG